MKLDSWQLTVGWPVGSFSQEFQSQFLRGRFRIPPQILRTDGAGSARCGPNACGRAFAAEDGMKEPSDKRKRPLALHERAIRFSAGVNSCCPEQFTTLPGRVVWDQLVRAAGPSRTDEAAARQSGSLSADCRARPRIRGWPISRHLRDDHPEHAHAAGRRTPHGKKAREALKLPTANRQLPTTIRRSLVTGS